MTATEPARPPAAATLPARSRGPLAFVVFALIAIFVVAHGCHGDDVDHEPSAAPPVRTPDGDSR